MAEIAVDTNLIAYCGLYCGSCGKYLSGKCPGCKKNDKATWCQVRACCMVNDFMNCVDCKTFADPMGCKKFNNIFSKIFGFIFRSNRAACIDMIRQQGREAFAKHMAANKLQSIKR